MRTVFLFSLIIFSLAVFRAKSIIWGDSLYYYAYTRSIIIDGDIDFSNEAYREDWGFPNEPEISKVTGKVINKFSPGSSILWMPAFLLGHLVSSGLEFMGIIAQADGYSFLTQYLVAVSTIIFSILGLFFVYKFILLFFEKKIAFLTTAFLYLTTQMFYYTSIDPLNSHSASFMLSSLFLYLLAIFSGKGKVLGKSFTWQKMLILGGLGGLITLVRNQDVILLLPATVYFLSKSKTRKDLEKEHQSELMEKLNKLVLFWGSVFLVMSIQLFITLDLYGQFGSPYILGGEKLSWFRPDFIRVLFSFGNGLFVFAPILIVAVLGLVKYLFHSFSLSSVKNKNKDIVKKHFALIAVFSFLLQLYVVASWGREIIGGPYGSRMFISVLPHLSMGLALIFDKFKKHKNFNLVAGASLVLLLINNLAQTAIMLIRF